jgi:FkbM family methyltransferase
MKELTLASEGEPMTEVVLPNGTVMVAPSHGLGGWTVRQLVRRGVYEPQMTRCLLERFRGGVFVDVGAQYGYYTLLMATEADFVRAYEPYVEKRKVLLENVTRNDLRNVDVNAEALFSADGEAWLHKRSSRVQTDPRRRGNARKVTIARFDNLGAGEVDAVKIDVEGAEVDVLEGMRGTLCIWRPLVLVEVHRRMVKNFGHEPRDVERFLKSIDMETKRLVSMGDRFHVAAW